MQAAGPCIIVGVPSEDVRSISGGAQEVLTHEALAFPWMSFGGGRPCRFCMVHAGFVDCSAVPYN